MYRVYKELWVCVCRYFLNKCAYVYVLVCMFVSVYICVCVYVNHRQTSLVSIIHKPGCFVGKKLSQGLLVWALWSGYHLPDSSI